MDLHGARIVLKENLKVSKKHLGRMLASVDAVKVKSMDEPFDIFVCAQSLPDYSNWHQTFAKKKKDNPELVRLDEYAFYAMVWNDTFLPNMLEEKLDGSLRGRRLYLMGEFSKREENEIREIVRRHKASLVYVPEEASLFVLGKKSYVHDPQAFERMLVHKSQEPYVKIISRSALQEKGKDSPLPKKKQKRERLYFGRPNPVSYPREYVALDLEATSDPSNNQIIEIGMVHVKDGQETGFYQSLVNPHKKLRPVIVNLTGIQDGMLSDAPDIQKLQKNILRFLKDLPVAGHSVQNDMKLLAENLNIPLDNNYIDTCKIALEKLPEREKFSLRSLADDYHLTRSTHRALDDAITSYQLLEKFKELFHD